MNILFLMGIVYLIQKNVDNNPKAAVI
jgi:hypothetical protein